MITIILRHARENLKKCSLKGLEKRSNVRFFTYPKDSLPEMPGYILLKVGAPPLTKEDSDKGLFIIDGTWVLAQTMEQNIRQNFIERSLPTHFRTAYPRRQTGCPDPETGLASIEALYIALFILDRPRDGLLDHYHWKDTFLKQNPELLAKSRC